MPLRGKMELVDPRQKQITNYFNKNAEETGKLESSGRLELLECDAVGLRGMAAGVRLESDAGPGLESEKELQE